MKINELIFRELPIKVILELRNFSNRKSKTRARELGCDYPYYLQLTKKINKAGIVTIKKKGNEYFTCLTVKGKKITDKIILLNEKLTK